MKPEDIIDALVNSPECIQQIINSLTGLDKDLEHYWGLNIKNRIAKIHYEYFGNPVSIPNKFIDKSFIPLHSHVGFYIPPEIMNEIKSELSKETRDEIDTKNNKIHGSSYPSKEDLMTFIMSEHFIFGVCSLYNGYAKISFYEPTSLDGDSLTKLLEEIFDLDNKIMKQCEKETTLGKAIELTKEKLNLWKESEVLSILGREPHSAHLIIPL